MSLQAPFAHYHPEDLDHNHATGLAHLHLGHLEEHDARPDGPAWDHADEDETAVSQEWSAENASRVRIVYVTTVMALAWEPQFVPQGVAPEFAVHSHDPPGLRGSPARAPPV